MSENIYYKHLRKNKYKHLRNEATIAAIILSNDEVSVGISICSRLDQFSKKEGRIIAAERAYFIPILQYKKDPSISERDALVRATLTATGMYVGNEKAMIKKVESLKKTFNQEDTQIMKF